MKFTWDEKKAALNKRKHGIAFEEAQTVLTIATHCEFLPLIIRKMKTGFCFLD